MENRIVREIPRVLESNSRSPVRNGHVAPNGHLLRGTGKESVPPLISGRRRAGKEDCLVDGTRYPICVRPLFSDDSQELSGGPPMPHSETNRRGGLGRRDQVVDVDRTLRARLDGIKDALQREGTRRHGAALVGADVALGRTRHSRHLGRRQSGLSAATAQRPSVHVPNYNSYWLSVISSFSYQLPTVSSSVESPAQRTRCGRLTRTPTC